MGKHRKTGKNLGKLRETRENKGKQGKHRKMERNWGKQEEPYENRKTGGII